MPFFRYLQNKHNASKEGGTSLEFRFIRTFLLFLMLILLLVGIILSASGVLDLNRAQTTALFRHELSAISERMETEYSTVSSHSIYLAKELSAQLERSLDDLGFAPSDISQSSDYVNSLLESLYPTLAAEIKALRSSGVFVMLDATINPTLENAANSKACIYLKNISGQNNTYSSRYDIRYSCGPLDIGRNHELSFLPQWHLEYDSSKSAFYSLVMEASAQNADKSLSQLYYWCPKASDGGAGQGMYCVVPLIASDGTVMGVCGFDISTMQFKLLYAPNVTGQDYLFCMMAPAAGADTDFDKAMFAGNYTATGEQPEGIVSIPSGKGLLSYICRNGREFMGMHRQIRLYPDSSVYQNDSYYLFLLTPSAQIRAMQRSSALKYLGILVALMAFGSVISIFFVKRNTKPIQKAFHDLKKKDRLSTEKTYIREIDDLFEYLTEKEAETQAERLRIEKEMEDAIARGDKAQATVTKLQAELYSEEVDEAQYARFQKNLNELTAKEKEVFDMYLQGYKAKDIAAALNISINTIKYHNKNIYDKLEVSSRSELLRYANPKNSK